MKRVIVLLVIVICLLSCSPSGSLQEDLERVKNIDQTISGGSPDSSSFPSQKNVDQKEEKKCNIPKTTRFFSSEPYYHGPLIDTHVHMPVASRIVSTVAKQAGFADAPYKGDLPIEKIVCLLEAEGITKIFGFFMAPNLAVGESVGMVKDIKQNYPNQVVAFYMPTPIGQLNPDSESVQNILEENPGLYQGYGEVKFDFHEVANDKPEDQQYLEAYQLADDHHLIVMMHPAFEHRQEVERILTAHPDTIFLLHGFPNAERWIGEVMDKHDNLYFSLDADLVSLYWFKPSHDYQQPTKEEWLAYSSNEETVQQNIKAFLRRWEATMKRHPDKFTWGTDRWYTWHFDPEASSRIEEIGRMFIAQLDPSLQEKFAYQNAEKMLEK